MTRRKLVALVSAAALFTLGLVAVLAVLFVTRTSAGRDRLLAAVKPFIASKVKNGSIYIGKLSGNFITSFTIDSLAIRDKRGELLVSTGRLTVWYNPRDLIDYRVYFRRVEVEHPYVHLIRHQNGVWNFNEIFASNTPTPPAPKEINTRSWGSYIVIDSTVARNASFYLTLPWQPDPSFRGASRDSVIRVHLTTPQKAVARTFDGFGRTYAWTNAHGLISHVRLADPDSDKKFGQEFRVEKLGVDEYEPTFKFRNVTADIRRLGDSVWFQVPRFDMPASTGHGQGRVWWGNGPIHYDIAIRGDSVSLDDVNWVYPTLPRTGGGALDLTIKNDPKNPDIVNFKLAKMDVRSTKSHLTGTMSFGTGAPLLLVRDVDLRGDPVNFDLLRTLAGKPFPEDWQGDITGTVRARGGPLTHFYVDEAHAVFADAHVRGAVSRASGRGELDILNPAFTAFHGFDVDAQSIDLRTIQYLFPAFPKLGGVAFGTATLDSSWLDVRFSNAQVALQNGPGEPTRLTGSGRITYGDPFMIYDVALDLQPLSLTMLARSPQYSWLPFRGLVNGPLRAKGSSPDLELTTSLQGSAGAISFDGHVDLDSVGGMGARGRGEFSNVNLGTLLANARIPEGVLSGHYDVDVSGETVATLRGAASVDIEPTRFDSVRVYPSHATVRFADGRMLVDSLFVRTAAATITAKGGIGLPKGRSDSLMFVATADSLGGFRRFISSPDTSQRGAAATLPDSLNGSIVVRGVASGTFDALDLHGLVGATNLVYNKEAVDTASAVFDLRDVLGNRTGVIAARADTLTLAGIALDSLAVRLSVDDSTQNRFAVSAASRTGQTASATGAWLSRNGAQTLLLDSLRIAMGDTAWHLASPARLVIADSVVSLDSLVLRNADSAYVALTAVVPDSGAVVARAVAAHIPLHDLGTLLQLSAPLGGVADFSATASGTKTSPTITATTTLSAVKWHGVDLDRVTSAANYAAGRLGADLAVVRKGQSALTASASLPLDVRLFGYTWRNDSVSGQLVADTTDLALVQALGVPIDSVAGKLSANVTMSGTPRALAFEGRVAVRNGAVRVAPLGVSLRSITGDLSGSRSAAGQDSIAVALSAANADRIAGRVSLNGWIKNLFATTGQRGATQQFSLTATARTFHAFDRRSQADLYLTTPGDDPLRLAGTTLAPTLTGSIVVDRGSIFLADRDIARKRAVDLFNDSTTTGGMSLGSSTFVNTLMTNLSPSVTVTLGNDVRLRSREANVKLEGSLQLTTSTNRSTRLLSSTGQLVPRLALEGTLHTASGSYTLNLGPVQREFTVLSDGTVTFAGDPANPTLDIHALYNVPRPGDRDLGVIVQLQGPLLPYPTISFGSTAGYDISTSDLVSYLLTGRPGFDFGASGQTLAQFLAPTISAVAAGQLRQSLGSWLDYFQFQLGTGSEAQQATFLSGQNLRQYIYGSTVGLGTRVGNNVYLNLNTGLCQFSPDYAGGRFSALTGFGASVEYRFDPKLSMQLAWDPPTANRICSQSLSSVGLVPTPGQASFSLSHTWRF